MATITRLTAAEVAAAVAGLPPMPASIWEVILACDLMEGLSDRYVGIEMPARSSAGEYDLHTFA